MRSVFGWAEARTHDATTATERSAAGWTVLISNIDHLCARLGGGCRLGGTVLSYLPGLSEFESS
eukprot:251762-Prymnesium_polylepis.1